MLSPTDILKGWDDAGTGGWMPEARVKAALVRLFSEELCSEALQFNLVVAGRSGVGKSSTVNTLVGEEVSKVDKYGVGTHSLKSFLLRYQGVHFSLSDTRGLCDDLPERNRDDTYLAEIRNCVRRPFGMLYVTEIDQARVASDEKRALKRMTEILGADVWERSVLVFTGADRVPGEQFDECLKVRTKLLLEELANYARPDIVYKIPPLALSNKSEVLPNGERWRTNFYTTVLSRMVLLPCFQKLKNDYGIA